MGLTGLGDGLGGGGGARGQTLGLWGALSAQLGASSSLAVMDMLEWGCLS